MEILLMILGFLVMIPLILIYGTFTKAFVLMKFYGWFILPIFITLPIFTFWQWVGLALFIQLFKSSGESIKDEYKDKKTLWFKIILGPWLVLLIGYLFYLFI